MESQWTLYHITIYISNKHRLFATLKKKAKRGGFEKDVIAVKITRKKLTAFATQIRDRAKTFS